MPALLAISFLFYSRLYRVFPISSQGHLILFNNYYSINSAEISIDQATILAHFGSLGGIIYYFKTLKGFLFSIKLIDRPDIDRNSFLMVNLIISSVPIFFIGYVVAKLINYNEEKL